MKATLSKLILTLCILLGGLQSTAEAWNDAGHMIVADIAMAHVTPEAKKEIERLIDLFKVYYPENSTPVTAACWADTLREHALDAFSHWHYVVIPYSPDNFLSQEDVIQIIDSNKDNNVKWAIKQCVNTLGSSKAKDFEKALMLRFLMHFVADIHQPMHCTTLYSQKFPKGDMGGNLFQLQGPEKNLHAYWDSAGGLFPKLTRPVNSEGLATVQDLSEEAMQAYPFAAAEERLGSRPSFWAVESYKIAISDAYAIEEGSFPSEEYTQKAQKICQERVALAGYRLANILNHLFDREHEIISNEAFK